MSTHNKIQEHIDKVSAEVSWRKTQSLHFSKKNENLAQQIGALKQKIKDNTDTISEHSFHVSANEGKLVDLRKFNKDNQEEKAKRKAAIKTAKLHKKNYLALLLNPVAKKDKPTVVPDATSKMVAKNEPPQPKVVIVKKQAVVGKFTDAEEKKSVDKSKAVPATSV